MLSVSDLICQCWGTAHIGAFEQTNTNMYTNILLDQLLRYHNSQLNPAKAWKLSPNGVVPHHKSVCPSLRSHNAIKVHTDLSYQSGCSPPARVSGSILPEPSCVAQPGHSLGGWPPSEEQTEIKSQLKTNTTTLLTTQLLTSSCFGHTTAEQIFVTSQNM